LSSSAAEARTADTDADEDSSGSEAEVDAATGVARPVLHPSELATTLLLEGAVTCSVLRCGGASDASGAIQPERWEGFWCHVISPIYFGRQGQSRVAGTVEKGRRSNAPPGHGSGGLLLGSSGRSLGSSPPGLLPGALPSQPRRRVRGHERDPYSQAPLVPDPRPGAAPGALVAKPRKRREPKPAARPSDPADLARQASGVWEKATKGGAGVAIGHDGLKHLTAAQFAALKHKELALMNLRQVGLNTHGGTTVQRAF
jgi:hypothetical protein